MCITVIVTGRTTATATCNWYIPSVTPPFMLDLLEPCAVKVARTVLRGAGLATVPAYPVPTSRELCP